VDFFIQLFTDPIGFWNSHTLLIAQIGINSILASSMFIVLYSGQLSLAAPGFMAIGAYTSVLMDLYWHTPLALNILVGVALAAAVGALVGLPVLRLRGVFLAIATIGFVEALRLGLILNVPITGEGLGLKNPNADPLGDSWLQDRRWRTSRAVSCTAPRPSCARPRCSGGGGASPARTPRG